MCLYFVSRWLFGEVTCQLYAMCGVLFGLCSLTNLTALSSVCCLKVCFPNHGEDDELIRWACCCQRNIVESQSCKWIRKYPNNCKAPFCTSPSDQGTGSPRRTPASWSSACGVTRPCSPSGPWHSGDVTALSLTARPAASTGTRPTASCRLCRTSSASSSFAMRCPAPSSSFPTRSFCWRCGGHARPSSSTCRHRPGPTMHTLSLSRSEDMSVLL